MPVKHALLALLAERDLTGYELKLRFERVLGEFWQLNSGQVYSTLEDKSIDRFAGFEYTGCCWRLRLLGRNYVSNRTGESDNSILLQVELNGLSSVGSRSDTFLERGIRGYSPASDSTYP